MRRLTDVVDGCPTQCEKQKRLNLRDKSKRTPLFYAMYNNNYEMVNYLLNNGAETLFSDDV